MIPKSIILGAKPICISCGCRHDYTENISCCKFDGYYCTECGQWIDEDDVYWVGDDPYCGDCVVYCERCNCCVPYNDAIRVNGSYYCQVYCRDCADDKAFYCESCDEWFTKENGFYDEYTDSWYCKVCYEELLKEREESEDDLDEKAI